MEVRSTQAAETQSPSLFKRTNLKPRTLKLYQQEACSCPQQGLKAQGGTAQFQRTKESNDHLFTP